jgi:hypothetical protein
MRPTPGLAFPFVQILIQLLPPIFMAKSNCLECSYFPVQILKIQYLNQGFPFFNKLKLIYFVSSPLESWLEMQTKLDEFLAPYPKPEMPPLDSLIKKVL